jgi:hypothetical protein
MDFEAPIFVPAEKKGRDWSNVIAYSCFGMAMLLAAISGKFPDTVFSANVPPFLYLFCLAPLGITLINMGRYVPMNGELKGSLKLDDHSISFNDRTLNYDDIESMDFAIGSYKDSRRYRSRGDFGPSLMWGVDNRIEIKCKASESISIWFQLENKEVESQLKSIIKELIIKGKVLYLKGLSLLQIHYSEVKEIKKAMGMAE